MDAYVRALVRHDRDMTASETDVDPGDEEKKVACHPSAVSPGASPIKPPGRPPQPRGKKATLHPGLVAYNRAI